MTGRRMKGFSTVLGFVLVVAMTLVSGTIHGRMSRRWGAVPAMLTAGTELEKIPHEFGAWRLQSSEALPEDVKKMLECTGSVVRTYVDRKTGQAVDVMVLVGPSGPISAHTPEVCFSSQNYTIVESRKRVSIRSPSGPENEFWALTFRSNDLAARTLQVYYGWSTDGRWSAPTQPRFRFATSPYLYKIQLSAYRRNGHSTSTNDLCRTFLEDCLPAIEGCLVTPSGK